MLVPKTILILLRMAILSNASRALLISNVAQNDSVMPKAGVQYTAVVIWMKEHMVPWLLILSLREKQKACLPMYHIPCTHLLCEVKTHSYGPRCFGSKSETAEKRPLKTARLRRVPRVVQAVRTSHKKVLRALREGKRNIGRNNYTVRHDDGKATLPAQKIVVPCCDVFVDSRRTQCTIIACFHQCRSSC